MSNFLQILGGLGVFLFGLRTMSTGLQRLAGDRLRAILGGLTKNRVAGIFSGFLITCAVQSSTATTVLVVSFANAGLLALAQCIGLIMGANIGTTVTGWLVSLLGFKVNIAAFALPVIGIAFPLSLMGSNRAKQLAEVLMGFGLLFLGLQFLKDGVPDLKSNPEALAFLQDFASHGFASVLLFILVGTVLTIIVQSSSATMTITLAMAAKGWIGYDVAAAMVLGENIGTTITATLAAIGANNTAKRVARSHTIFNLIGVLWMLPLLDPFLRMIDTIVPGDPLTNPAALPTHLAAFHTAFNVINTVMLAWFVPQFERVVKWLVPVTADEHEGAHLKFLESGAVGAPELASIEARRALQMMVGVCGEMFGKVQHVLTSPDQKLGKVVDEIKRGEAKTDEMEEEIVAFCSELARSGTSQKLGREVATYLDMANDIERIGDHCFNLVLLGERRYEKQHAIHPETQKELAEMMEAVAEFLALAGHALEIDEGDGYFGDAKLLESKINKLRDQARKRYARRMKDGEVDIRAGLVSLDMMTNLEKIGDYCFNVVKAVKEVPRHQQNP
jgi:phosphate:Na+ symporter